MTPTRPEIPNGGFLTAKYTSLSDELLNRLNENGAQVISFPNAGVLLASWHEFPGQGVWSGTNAAVAFDLALTNENALWQLVDAPHKGQESSGLLIWLLYKKFGLDFIDHLRGAFAFSLWDGIRLIIVTDYFGIRPVVYSNSKSGFIAASRIRHLLLDDTLSDQINPEAIYHYLFFQAVCSPVSIYKNIRKLEPGKGLRFQNNNLTEFRHYDIEYRPSDNHNESFWTGKISEALKNAVSEFIPPGAPEKTGCFLSGGTDSSSVAGYYTQLSGRPAKTFSIGFAEPKYNELDFAHIASRRFGTEQHEYSVTPEDVTALIDMLPRIYDEPFGNASVFPAYYCARLAKEKGIGVLLGGDGGDEIFGGNERYVSNLIFEKYFSIPKTARTLLLEPLMSKLPPKGIIRKARNYIRRANMKNPRRFYSYNLLAETDPGLIFQDDFLGTIDTDCFLKLAEAHYQRDTRGHDTDRLLYIDMKFTITDNDLRKVTQMAESAGVQVQYPFLDRDLVDFSATIPPDLKVKWGKNRYIFKKAMKGFLPDEILEKSKHGMGLPIAPWFKKDPRLIELLNDTLFSGIPKITEYIKPKFLDEMKSSFKTDTTAYYGDSLWVYLLLELWLRNRIIR